MLALSVESRFLYVELVYGDMKLATFIRDTRQ